MALSYNLRSNGGGHLDRKRLALVHGVLLLTFCGLLWRLYGLQILRGEELQGKGQRNIVQKSRIPHDRGIVYDRLGRILIDNRASLDLLITPAFLGKPETSNLSLLQLAKILHLEEAELTAMRNSIVASSGLTRFKPIVVYRDLSLEQVEAIELERSIFHLDGVEIGQGRRRVYHYGQVAAHLLGYIGEIDALALEGERLRGNPLGYELGDGVGKEGIEKVYESELRGEDGILISIVDAKGRRQTANSFDFLNSDIPSLPPKPGRNLVLTLDIELQAFAEKTFARYSQAGSVVVLHVPTGAVLVMVSLPAYDANRVGLLLSKKFKLALDQDPLKPWINRTIAGQYAPGSTFKVITALAALKANLVSASENIHCPGNFRLGRHSWRCWKDTGHGPMNLISALQRSCDTYFYTLGLRVGIDPLAMVAKMFSFGERTGIGLRGEMPGLVPTEAFHNQVDASSGGYQRGMVINTAIGQGSLLVTPLQLAVAYAAIAHGNQVLRPRLLERIESPDYRIIKKKIELQTAAQPPTQQVEITGKPPQILLQPRAEVLHTLPFDPSHLQVVRDGLYAASNMPGGTSYWHRPKLVEMAGKTGTAQVVRLKRERTKNQASIDYLERDHAWFVGYAPAKKPEIVVVVLGEHAGHGGSVAAPIATEIIDYYFKNNLGQSYLRNSPPRSIAPLFDNQP